MVAKIRKINFAAFDPMTWVLSIRVEDTPLQQFLLSRLCSFDFIF